MKNNILFLSLIAFTSVFSQVTINRSHIVVSGQKVIEAYDLNVRSLAASGQNMTWNFTNLSADTRDSLRFAVASWYPGASYFPQANLAMIYYDDDSNITFMGITNTELKVYGNYTMTDTGNMAEKYETRMLTFPSTYNTSFSDAFSFPGAVIPLGLDPDASGPLPFIDSVMISFKTDVKSNIDGWGTVKTPLGNYPSLRQTIRVINAPSAKMYSGGFGFDVPQSLLDALQLPIPTGDTSYTVNFWTNDASVGYPLVTYDYNEGQTTTSSVTWLMAKPKASNIETVDTRKAFAYPNPALQYLTIACPVEHAKISLYDMNGQLVLEQIVNNGSQVALQGLSSGIYRLQMVDSSSGFVISTQMVVKQ